MSIGILLLAAGGSTRMRGGDKLLEPIEGVPLVRRSALTALASAADEVIVVLGAIRDARAAALEALPIRIVHNENWSEGMGTSIAVGAAALAPDTRAVMVLPADMPDLTPALLDALFAALPTDASQVILRPRTGQGKPGNPVLFGADHIPALGRLSGDTGARAVIADSPSVLRYLDVGGEAVLTDLDTPEAWAAYRAGNKS